MSHKITLVDDDQNILISVKMALETEGFAVTTYSDGEAGLAGLSKTPADLAILDIKMPRMDGMELLENLRQSSDIPVIFLTSKDDEIDQLRGLKMGADDYITKPFSQRLLIERIRALLRRQDLAKQAKTTDAPQQNEQLVRGALIMDDARHLCSWDGQPLNLTVTEYLLIKALAVKPGHVKNRDRLIDYAYGENIYVDDRIIDSHIKRIRKKFKKIDEEFDHIETLYGAGYKYKEE